MMDKRSDLGSSIYLSQKAGSLSSQQSHRHKTRRTSYKVEIINQNLEDAIKQIKLNVKENPEWNLKVKSVSQNYSNKKQSMAVINQSQQEAPGTDVLPQSSKQPQPQRLQPCKKISFEHLKYTERKKKQYVQRLKSLKQKRMQQEVISLEKQVKAKLQRKIKENQHLKEKAKLIQDIQERRQDYMRISDHQQYRRKQQKSLLHQSNLAKVEMLRKSKKKSRKIQLNQSLSRSQQSKLDLKFKEYLIDKQKQQRKQMLVARYRMIKSASQGQFRSRAQARAAQSSQSTKRLKNSDVVYI